MVPDSDRTTPPATGQPATPVLSSFERKIEKPRSNKSSLLSTIMLFLLAPIIAFSVTTYMFQSYEVDGESMETTLQNHDRLIVDKIPRTWSRITKHSYIPPRGEIIIFNQHGLFEAQGSQERQLIKRVIGLPGERVVVKNGEITVYNTEHPNGFNPDSSGLYTISAKSTSGDVDFTLKADQIFVCGDNRNNSADSREFGPIHASEVVGKLSLRILPLSKAEKF